MSVDTPQAPAKKTVFERWQITPEQFSELVDANGSLRGVALGYVAELKFHELMQKVPGVVDLGKDDDHDRSKKGDRRINYKGEEFKLEVKSLQTNLVKRLENGRFEGRSQVDASDERTVTLPTGEEVQTTCLVVGEFDVLVVNCFAFHDEWLFLFAENSDLSRSRHKGYTESQKEHLLATLVPVIYPLESGSIFSESLTAVLDRVIEKRQAAKKAGTAPEVSIIEEEDGDIVVAVEN